MKSKMKRRMLAIVLCMVIVLSNSSFIFASSESGTPAVEAASTEGTTSQTETDTQGTETTPQTLAVSESTPAPTDEPAAPTSVEATPTPTDTPEVTTTPEPTGTPTPEATPTPTDTPETTTTPEPTDTPEITTTPEPTDAPETTTTPEPTDTPEATPTPTQGPENGTSDTAQPTATPTPTEAPVKSNEAVELKQEFKDSDGNVTSTVKAQIPEGTFAADASEITMEVQTPDTASAEHVKEMMEELLPENHMLGDYIFYDIQFKVNGTVTEPQKPITITFEGEKLSVKDVKRANVFWLDPEDPQVDGDKDQLVEITQKSEMIENLQNSGQSTENIDDYDLSEITLKEDGTSDKIQMEGRTSTIYGCYVEKEVVKELVYEDNSVTITVSADESGVIPEDAELSVTPLVKTEITDNMSEEEKAQAEEINAQYDLTEKKLQEDSEENEESLEGFLAYDISFLVNGEEVEPDGDVRVVIDFKNAAIPEGVSEDATVEVKHLKEVETAEDGIAVEDMTEKSTVRATDKAEVQRVELTTDSFSTYTVNWYTVASEMDTPSSSADGVETRNTRVQITGSKSAEGYKRYHNWQIEDDDVARLSGASHQTVTVTGEEDGTTTITHTYGCNDSNANNKYKETFYIEVEDGNIRAYVKVYVYVASYVKDENGDYILDENGEKLMLSDECLKLLGIDRETIDSNGYFPAGEIYLDLSFFDYKASDEMGTGLIENQRDWSQLLEALGEMNTTTLVNQEDWDYSGAAENGKRNYSLNCNNKVGEYLDQAEVSYNQNAGSQKTALFRWHYLPSYPGNASYGFEDQNVNYHLDLTFSTKRITFILGNNGIDKDESSNAYDGFQIDSRAYITGSEIQDPRNLKIPEGYYFDGFYEDKNFTIPWDEIGNPITEDQVVYIKLSSYPVLTLTKIFDGLSDEEVNYLIFGRDDGFGWDINYCNKDIRWTKTESNEGFTFMEDKENIPPNFKLPDGKEVTDGGGFRITAAQFLKVGDNKISDISDIEDGLYENSMTGATLCKKDGNWVYSVSLKVPPTDADQFYTVFEQHQEVPGYAKINDSNAKWEIIQNGTVTVQGTGKYIDNFGKNIYERMEEINSGLTDYNGKKYNEMEDVCIAAGAFKRIKIETSTTITFTNHYKGDLDVTKEIGNNNQYTDANNKYYTITIQPANLDKLALGFTGSHGLAGKSFTYQIVDAQGKTESTATLNENGAFDIQLKPGQVAHFTDMPAIQWKVTESSATNAVEGYTLKTKYKDENNGVVETSTHWNGYSSSDTIGTTDPGDGIASVDSAVTDIENPVVDADAVAKVIVTNTYIPITGNLTVTKDVVGAEVQGKEYLFTISTNNALVAGKTYGIHGSDGTVLFSDTPTDGQYTATVSIIATTANGVDGSITIDNLPAGTYTVIENEAERDIEGYNFVSVGYMVNESETGSVSIANGATGQIDVTNTYAKRWQLVKISSSPGINGQKLYLGGAIFTATETTEHKTYSGSSAANTGVISWNDGSKDIGTMLPDGTYTITETQAPKGYVIQTGGWTLIVKDGKPTSVKQGVEDVKKEQVNNIDIYYLENEPLYDLPSAGSSGIFGYTMGGTLLLMAGTLILYKMKRKEVQGS